mgnify:CR=1 FL=1
MIINGYNPQLNIRPDMSSGNSGSVSPDAQGGQAGQGGSSLAGLTGGDVLSGRIMSRDGNEVRIALGGNSEITARLDVSAELPVGSTVAFTVMSSDRSGITLSPLLTNTDLSSPVNTALMNAGLAINERTAMMVTTMMEQGMPIGKDELLQMSNVLNGMSAADVPNAVTLTHLGIEPTPDNMAQFESYLNYEHQISTAVNEIMEMVPETISEMISGGDVNAAIDMTRDVLDVFTGQGAMLRMDENELISSGMQAPVNVMLSQSELTELGNLLTENGIDPAFAESMASGEVSLSDVMFVIDDVVNNAASERMPSADGSEVRPAPDDAAANAADGRVMTEGARSASLEDIPLPSGMSDAGTAAASEGAGEGNKSGSVGLDFLNALKPDSMDSESLSKAIGTAETINKNAVTKGVLDLIRSKPMSTILQNAVNNQWKLTPKQVGEEKSVEDLYKRMTEQTSRVLEALNHHSKADSPLAASIGELNKNMNFMNELNETFNYVQLPMKLSGNDAHGELYVYSNKKHMASKDGNVSALLHLDMDHLGATDVYVTMNSSNHVNTHFYLPDDESLDLIAAHMDELNARIESRGYTCTAQTSKRDEMTNVMEEIIEDNKPAIPVATSNFDARA